MQVNERSSNMMHRSYRDAGSETRRRSSHWLMLSAWAEYQATGQHVTATEADTWLARLEAGEDSEPPTPHD